MCPISRGVVRRRFPPWARGCCCSTPKFTTGAARTRSAVLQNGLFQLARDYFEKAAAAANPPPEVQARVKQYLFRGRKAPIASSLVRSRVLWQPISIGRQCRGLIRIPNTRLPLLSLCSLTRPFNKQAYGSVFGSGSLLYSYELETQNRDTLEVTTVNYVTISTGGSPARSRSPR